MIFYKGVGGVLIPRNNNEIWTQFRLHEIKTSISDVNGAFATISPTSLIATNLLHKRFIGSYIGCGC